MTGLVRKATLIVVLGLLAASAAMAGVPNPSSCIVPAYIDLVGCKAGVVDPYGAFTVLVRDVGNFPVVNSEVCINFTNCDPKPYNANIPAPVQTVTCPSVCATTDNNGFAHFDIWGAAANTGGNPVGAGLNCASVFAGITPIGTTTVTAFDENGRVSTKGVEATDLSAWLSDFGKKGIIGYKGRSDYNHNADVEAVDLSTWLKVFGLGNSAPPGCATTFCP
jgi:hypothetical protein